MKKRLGFDMDRHWDIALVAGMVLLGLYDPLFAFCLGAFRDSPLPVDPVLWIFSGALVPASGLALLVGTARSVWWMGRRIGKVEWGVRIFILAVVVFLSVGEWTGLAGYALARGTRWRIEREIPLADFQRWVVDLNRDYGADVPDLLTKDGHFDPCVPERVRHLVNPEEYDISVIVVEMPDAASSHSLGPGLRPGMAIAVSIAYGGGFLHWGAVVGPPGFVSNNDEMTTNYYRWANGVYGFVQ